MTAEEMKVKAIAMIDREKIPLKPGRSCGRAGKDEERK
jgi:hypothetical protein